MLRRNLVSLLATLSLTLTGCAGTIIHRYVDLERYPVEKPLVVGMNGLATNTVGHLTGALSMRYNFPFVVSDVSYWRDNMDEIREANEQGRKIILISASAGCHDSLLTAEECEKEGIGIESMVYINPFYTLFWFPGIPQNVQKFSVYFSTKFDLMWWANGDPGKFRDISNGKTYFEEPKFIDSTHSNYASSPVLKKGLERLLRLE